MQQFCASVLAIAVVWVGSAGWWDASECFAAERWLEENGKAQFNPSDQEALIAPRFQMKSHGFDYQMRHLPHIGPGLKISDVTFPSPVTTAQVANNTVHCEYYRPAGPGPFPAVVVLHILGGDFPLSRLFANSMAQHGIAALFLKMPYYGPRRGTGTRRMITPDPQQMVEGMTQAVLDIRRATAWLQSRPEVDGEKLGIFGISLGGITGALAATAEPRLRNLCLLLAGGNVGEVTWTSRETRKLKEQWLARGGTKEELLRWLVMVDPVTYGERVRNDSRKILMINATHDEVVPKSCTMALWESFGKPPIEWYSGGHYSVIRHIVGMLSRVPKFFLASSGQLIVPPPGSRDSVQTGAKLGETPRFPGRVSQWNGFQRYDYEVDGKPVLVVTPMKPAKGNPWVWHGEFFGHKPAPDIALLQAGFHIVYMRVPNMLGSPAAVKHWDAFYKDLTRDRGLAPKAALVGLSRGGLYCYNWAAANPNKVACIYGDAPVCDFKSWPGGKPLASRVAGAPWTGAGSDREWKRVLSEYQFADEQAALAYTGNPVDNLKPLAAAGVPLLHVFGDADRVVPWEENTGVLAKRYRKLGGDIQLIRKPGIDHHPHGLDDSTPIVEFIQRAALGN